MLNEKPRDAAAVPRIVKDVEKLGLKPVQEADHVSLTVGGEHAVAWRVLGGLVHVAVGTNADGDGPAYCEPGTNVRQALTAVTAAAARDLVREPTPERARLVEALHERLGMLAAADVRQAQAAAERARLLEEAREAPAEKKKPAEKKPAEKKPAEMPPGPDADETVAR